jgi:hypothetical protein
MWVCIKKNYTIKFKLKRLEPGWFCTPVPLCNKKNYTIKFKLKRLEPGWFCTPVPLCNDGKSKAYSSILVLLSFRQGSLFNFELGSLS